MNSGHAEANSDLGDVQEPATHVVMRFATAGPPNLTGVDLRGLFRRTQPHLTRDERETLVRIVLLARTPDREHAFIRMTRLAPQLECTDRTLRTRVNALVADGWVTKTRTGRANELHPNWQRLRGLMTNFADQTGNLFRSHPLTAKRNPAAEPAAAQPATPTPKPRVNTVHRTPPGRPPDPPGPVTAVHIAPVVETAEAGREAGDGADPTAPPSAAPGQRLAPIAAAHGIVPAGAALPPVDVPPQLLVAVMDEHGPDAMADVRDTLDGADARAHPDAARLAVQRMAQLRRHEVRRSAGAAMRSYLALAIAGKLRSHNEHVGSAVLKRIREKVEGFEQRGMHAEAARMREMGRIEAMVQTQEREKLLLQDPDIQRVERMAAEACRPTVQLPPTYAPAPRERDDSMRRRTAYYAKRFCPPDVARALTAGDR